MAMLSERNEVQKNTSTINASYMNSPVEWGCVWQGFTGKRHEGTFWKCSVGMWVTQAPAFVSLMN